MTHLPPFSPRRQSPFPVVLAGAAFVLAAFMVLDRTGMFSRAPSVDPRPITPRGDLMEIEKTTTTIFEQYSPSVVHITTEAYARDWFGRSKVYQEGTGTGFLWDDLGTVVTNYHVVKTVVEARSKLKVAIGDELYDGTVVGSSQQYDIAVLRIIAPPKNLQPLPLGSSADLKVGQFVLAIGNPFGFDRSLSTGIISALNRSIATEQTKMAGLIQTDAAINPGNSGGPLLDSAGRLIGMNTAIYSPSGSSAGIGFAVPVDTINDIVPALLDGKSAQRNLGIFPLERPVRVPRDTGYELGVPVMGLEAGAGAEAAGIQPFQLDANERVVSWGDIIVAVDGSPVRSQVELARLLRGRKRGEKVEVTVVRGDPNRAKVVQVSVPLK
ncbi:MAG: trypsin-like peptidase domain-containing protein [Planctomycetes bacterium]|nr:trypsin-like peptidase domain-containing protein [Planctomycetota bacterium]